MKNLKRNIIFFKPEQKFSPTLSLNQDEINHLRSLRLLEKKIEIEIRDGNGKSCFYEKSINSTEIKKMKECDFQPKEKEIRIATAIPKGNLFNLWLTKGTEIGVSHFYFLIFQNSERKDFNLKRSQKIVQQAASQSRRYYLPTIDNPLSFQDFVQPNQKYILLHPTSKCFIQKDSLKSNSIFLIGPEGGFNQREIEFAKEKNISFFHLGKNILRIETACIYIASLQRFLS